MSLCDMNHGGVVKGIHRSITYFSVSIGHPLFYILSDIDLFSEDDKGMTWLSNVHERIQSKCIIM